ncbi:MAG: molybdopterin-binding protein [Eubacteriales bacterium]|nr:molybdopterin-binding protein [Eubacteriales bacterium]MDD3199184.1 molybdopterin-binding protein [Eubacteriales bacterium]MDD4629161.1 molybdopterin-binding protein [Eubacteriales bacterium]
MKLLKVDTVNEVKEKLKNYFGEKGSEAPAENVPLRSAVSRYLAENIYSDMDIPHFTRSVVDGYAVNAKDTFGIGDSSPVFLDIVGSVEMGKSCNISMKQGEAVYIPTGGMLPEGADAVVMIEYVEALDDRTIAVYKSTAPNSGIMNQGDDFKKGQLLFCKGHRLTVKDVGMLAAIGKDYLNVFQKPRVSILSTGDEIIDIAKIPDQGEVRDINSYTIAAFAEHTGAIIEHIEKVPDISLPLRKALKKAIAESDIVLLSGGSSAGNKDITAEVIDSMGQPGVITHGIAMKPGKPTIIGIIDEVSKTGQNRGTDEVAAQKLVVGLPGHPMAAIVAYDIIVNYFIRQYWFANNEEPLQLTARITENVPGGEGRETYQLVSLKRTFSKAGETVQEWIAEPIHAKSGSISQLMTADGYVKIASLSEGIREGSMAEVTLIGR